MNIAYEDGVLTGLFDILNIYILENSIVQMTGIRTFNAYVIEDNMLQDEIQDFNTDYFDSTKEQGYIKSVERLDVETRELFYIGTNPTAAYQEYDIFQYGEGYFYDSGMFSKNVILHICLQTITD